ncbi:MAG: PAS domain S-box protein [Sulfuritalea sp.]|nr:PAS domain S-box protein [Sulfuritalea sp.]
MTVIDKAAAQQLREYELIFQHAQIGILVVRDRVIQRCNPRLEELLGYRPGELIGQNTQVYYQSEHAWRDTGRRAYPTIAETGSFTGEVEFRRRDGSVIWCQIIGSLVNQQNPDEGHLWLYNDLTAKRQAEDELTALLREQTLIFERAHTGIMFVRGRVIQRCNPRFEIMFGHSPGVLVGQSTRVLFSDDRSWFENGERVYAILNETGVFDDKLDYVRGDGSPICCHVVSSLLEVGNPAAGTVWLYEDITTRRATEQALEQSLQEQQLIFDNALIGISYQRDRTILRCNRRLEEMFGYGPGGLDGQSTRVLFATESDWQATGRRVYKATGGDQIFDGEISYSRRDGTLIWVHVIGRTVGNVEGLETWIWIYDDITARRAAEEALTKKAREYALIFDNAMIGIAYIRNRVLLRCNRQYEEMFGFQPGDLLGRATRLLFATDAAFEDIGRRMDQARLEGGGVSAEILHQRKDMTPIWVRINGQPIQEGGEEVWIWTCRDVTRRHQAEEALHLSYREMEQRVAERTAEVSRQLNFMEQLIEAIPGPVFYKDRGGHYLGFNQRYLEFLDMPRDKLLGATVYDIAPKELADRYKAADDQLFNNPGSQVYETQVQPAKGERREVLFHKATFANDDGSVGGLIGVMFDITERKRMEERMQQAATVFDTSLEGITITAPDGSIIAVNRAFTEITGYSESEVIGRNPRILQSDRQDSSFYRAMWDAIQRHGRWQGEIWNKRKDGSLFPESLTISAVTDSAGKIIHYVGVFSDITEIKRANDLLAHQAHHDHLTGLPNRLLLEDRLHGALLRAQREQTQVAVLFVDLDRFKNINDSLGHSVGDGVLRELATRLGTMVRESDTVARLGGDEFLIVMEGIHDPTLVSRIAEKILDDLRLNPVVLEQEFFVGASIGIAFSPQDGNDFTSLIKNADAAMYRAKERGRNTYEFFTGKLTQSSLDRFRMETDLRRAIERDELQIYLQPQYSLRSGKMLGAEALVRWQHPQMGLVMPSRFIPLAEESGLIVALGAWVQHAACAQWAAWVSAGLNPGVLSINVSSIEFRRGQIQGMVRNVLDLTRLAPELLELEITESAIMSQVENSVQVLHDLREMGINLAIDDFGTGYSSLAYLKRLPLDKLKVDQSFVRGLPGDPEDGAIVRAVIALGHSLQLKVIAEGVETDSQRQFLVAAGCDEMQGYLRGKPIPVEDFSREFLGA